MREFISEDTRTVRAALGTKREEMKLVMACFVDAICYLVLI